MPFRPSTPVLTGVALIVLIPLSHLSLTPGLFSTHTFSLINHFRLNDRSGFSNHPPAILQDELLYKVGNISYFSPQAPWSSLSFVALSSSEKTSSTHFPSTAFRLPLNKPVLDAEALRDLINDALAFDDVLSRDWLSTLLLVSKLDNTDKTAPVTYIDRDTFVMLEKDFGVQRVFVDPSFYLPRGVALRGLSIKLDPLFPPPKFSKPLNGPYLTKVCQDRAEIDLWPVYRLYSDVFRTFLFGTYRVPKDEEDLERGFTYKTFRHRDDRGYLLIPVPSRLYTLRLDNGVSGQRIGVKDMYDIRGLPTSAGSRAYGELHKPVDASASSLLPLENLGGLFVGKTRSAPFAMGRANAYMEEQSPFSARADLWQGCAGSSSGSGCAMGAYDWLDIALGTDTGGSVRVPAARVGVYGNRPTFGAVPLDGIVPLLGSADTAGALGRDPKKFTNFLRSWREISKPLVWSVSTPQHLHAYPYLPRKLKVSRAYLKQESNVAQNIIDNFIDKIKDKLNMQVEEIDLNEILADHGYSRARVEEMISDHVDAARWWLWVYSGNKFQEDYANSNEDRHPPIDPYPREAWETVGKSLTWEKYHRANNETAEFGRLFVDEVLPPDEETCSESIFVYEITQGGDTLYREDALNKARSPIRPGNVIAGKFLSPWSGSPDIAITIGQAPFQSLVSKKEEKRPVALNLVAHPGCDFMLYDFVDKLAEVGLIKEVKTGRTAF